MGGGSDGGVGESNGGGMEESNGGGMVVERKNGWKRSIVEGRKP